MKFQRGASIRDVEHAWRRAGGEVEVLKMCGEARLVMVKDGVRYRSSKYNLRKKDCALAIIKWLNKTFEEIGHAE